VGRVEISNVTEIVDMIVYVEPTVIGFKPYCLGLEEFKGETFFWGCSKIWFMCLAYVNWLLFGVQIGIF